MLKKLWFLLAAVALAACASAGQMIDRTHLNDVKNGVTKTQIESWFGKPYTVKTGLVGHPTGGVERWTYEYAEARGRGRVTYSEILVVDFNAKGKVCDHAFSQTGRK